MDHDEVKYRDLNITCECDKFRKECRQVHGRKLQAGQDRIPKVEAVLDDKDEEAIKKPCTEYLKYEVKSQNGESGVYANIAKNMLRSVNDVIDAGSLEMQVRCT